MDKKSVLVTGATGFIGKHLIANLLNEGLSVYALTRKSNCELSSDERIKIIVGDITEKVNLPADVKTIYHCAGVISDEEQMEKVNVYGTQKIVEAALKQNCRLIHLSSAGVVGKCREDYIDENIECHPQNLYEQTKFKAEEIVKKGIDRGLKAQILRPTIVFGIGRDSSKDSFFQLVKAIKAGHYKNIKNGSGIYNIIHVNEVVSAMRALDSDDIPNGRIYFINSPISFSEFSAVVRTATTGEKGKVDNIPYPIAFMAATVFSALSAITGKKMPLTFSRLRALTNKKAFSQNRILEMTSYRPLLAAEDYIRQICKEYTENGLLN